LATMPDVALGWAGRLEPVAYPRDLGAATVALDRARSDGRAGDVLLLPLSSYRAPSWNRGRKVLDPTGRFLGGGVVAGDDLFVSGRRVAGEDPRVRRVARDLQLPGPGARAGALASDGIGFVVTERDAGPSPRVAGTDLLRSTGLRVQVLSGARMQSSGPWRTAVVSLAWVAYAGGPLVGLALAVVRRRRASGTALTASSC
ncbi:MAG: hypothetical protein JWR42_2651, partial [Marmoricola sp.]|nr:hypothetical protein [Marmoricola sp.]